MPSSLTCWQATATLSMPMHPSSQPQFKILILYIGESAQGTTARRDYALLVLLGRQTTPKYFVGMLNSLIFPEASKIRTHPEEAVPDTEHVASAQVSQYMTGEPRCHLVRALLPQTRYQGQQRPAGQPSMCLRDARQVLNQFYL